MVEQNKFIPLTRPDIREEDISLVVEVLKSGMLVQGKHVLDFEDKAKKFTKSTYNIAVSNGTASLHLALKALNIGIGDEVIVPAFSYIASANVVELVGAKPVFVDISLDSFTIDADSIENAITSKTKAIMPVHEFGLCVDMDKVNELAKQHSLFIIEDSACALGATYKGKAAGSIGHFGSFSLHPRKAITSGEGGLVTTNDKDLDAKIRTLRNHGIDFENPTEFSDAGYNYRLTDFQAALVSSQLNRFSETLKYKRELASIYLENVISEHIVLPKTFSDREHTWQTFHILTESNEYRKGLISHLKSHNIQTNYGAQCIPHMKFYAEKYGYNALKEFPNAYRAYSTGLALPLYELLTKEDILRISNSINQYRS